jgi:organic hydroperoxide reductase OsmC/OhrA
MLQPDKILYEAEVMATWRDGKAASRRFCRSLSPPRSLGGPGEVQSGQFAAGHAACFLGAVKLSRARARSRCRRTDRHRQGRNEAAVGYALPSSLAVLLPGLEKPLPR